MSPTQAYIVHNGNLTALPEPQTWQRPGKLVVPLKRVPGHSEETDDEADLWDEDAGELPLIALPSLPLGSGTGIEVDLVYRRVEAGDLIAVVSSSLARHLDRPLAEEIFVGNSADDAIAALYAMASKHGLAQSHALVLQLGVDETTGVDTDLVAHVAPPTGESMSANGGVRSIPPGPAAGGDAQPHEKFDAFKGPRQWLQRRKSPVEAEPPETLDVPISAMTHQPAETEAHVEIEDKANEEERDLPDELPSAVSSPNRPTEILLQRQLDVPPYKTKTAAEPQRADDGPAELEFDGWEDLPPALQKMGKGAAGANGYANGAATQDDVWTNRHAAPPPRAGGIDRTRLHPVPTLFDESDEDGQSQPTLLKTAGAQAEGASGAISRFGKGAGAWVGGTLRNMLPDSAPEQDGQPASQAASQPGGRLSMLIPARLLIIAGVVLLVGILAFSVLSMMRNPRQAEVANYLNQAKQEDLLANQSGTLPAERLGHLNKTLELAQQALKSDPQSKEAELLVHKTETTLDTLQGVTRVEPKLLFDLDATTSTTAGAATSQGAAGAAATGTITGTAQPGVILVQSNDAYVLDKDNGKIYRCRIAARDCTTVLKSGDSAGGQKVGPLLGMTLRVGNLVALDKNLTAFVFSADTSAWQAQALGGAQGLDKPKDIASYDGHLYLLASKGAQISKYVSGRYDQPPEDWIKDTASLDQVKNPVSFGIDGAIYILLSDGKILVLQGGQVVRTIPAKAADPNPPTELYTSTDTQDLYLLRPTAASISRMTKEGQVRATFKPGAASGISALSGMTVDEGSGKLYMLAGHRVYEAPLRAAAPGVNTTGTVPQPAGQSQPVVRPTAAP